MTKKELEAKLNKYELMVKHLIEICNAKNTVIAAVEQDWIKMSMRLEDDDEFIKGTVLH